MVTRRRILGVAAGALGAGAGALGAGCLSNGVDETDGTDAAGGTTSIWNRGTAGGPLTVESSAFDEEAPIPHRYTKDGANVSPPIEIGGVPEGAASLALVVDDPDAPNGSFVHWVVWNLPPDVGNLPEDVPTTQTLPAFGDARQGTNGFGVVGYRGPAPPSSDGPHTYRFKLAALDTTLDLQAGSNRSALSAAMDGHVLHRARVTGTYDR